MNKKCSSNSSSSNSSSGRGERARSWRAVEMGRALELTGLILADATPDQVEAFIELLAGITDEYGDNPRHIVAAQCLSFAFCHHSNDWWQLVQQIQRRQCAGQDEEIVRQ